MKMYARFTPRILAVFAVAMTLYSCTAVAPAPSRRSSPTSTATPSPTPSPMATPTAAPSVTPTPSGRAPTETFTSEVHGISISYPAGWSVQRASEPWTGGPFFFREPVGDFLYDRILTDHLFLALASQPVADSSTDTWADDLLAAEGCGNGEPVVVDGTQGLVGSECGVALVEKDGRGYFIWLYVSGDDPELREIYDRAWFDRVLATVRLNSP